ncbi:hypothetical protein [Herpetosiphon llansteffanensis]|uniref:hypothetical protein n=1 Tax=Herpetosiphon llansteffanensis TaxID=2094568 RepID=UPI000D7BD536|nr:hypothetical protein [Herpetosiphon llansteffanensis]
MRRLMVFMGLFMLVGCTQHRGAPSVPPATKFPPSHGSPVALIAPTNVPITQPSSVPTAKLADPMPTIPVPPTSTPIPAPPFTGPVDLIIAGLDVSGTTVLISQFYGDHESRPRYTVPCFDPNGCEYASIFSIPQRQELALKIESREDSRLYLINLETQTHHQIADHLLGWGKHIVAAPDGNTIAFLRENSAMTRLAPVPVAAIWGYSLKTNELFAITDWQNLHQSMHWSDETTLLYTRRYDGDDETWQVAIDDREPARKIYKGNTIAVLDNPARWFIERWVDQQLSDEPVEVIKFIDQYQPDHHETVAWYPAFQPRHQSLMMHESPDLHHALLIESDHRVLTSTLTLINPSATRTLSLPHDYFISIVWSSDNRYAFLVGTSSITPVDTEQAIIFAAIPSPRFNTVYGPWFLAAQGR